MVAVAVEEIHYLGTVTNVLGHLREHLGRRFVCNYARSFLPKELLPREHLYSFQGQSSNFNFKFQFQALHKTLHKAS